MNMSMKMKYAAAGFLDDAGRLLNDFVDRNSLDFPVFATAWREHHFSLVFMGRVDDHELTDYTNEVFRISSQFLSSLSFPYQVGAIYLIYGLFRNQISNPPIKVRIESCQYDVIYKIYLEAVKKRYRTLHYVIEYLCKNGFLCVVNQTMRGPLVASIQKVSKASETISTLMANYKVELSDYSVSNNLQALNELYNEYMETKMDLDEPIKVDRLGNPGIFEQFMGELSSIVDSTGKGTGSRGRKGRNNGDIGHRRSKIKAAAFSKKSHDFWGRQIDSDDSDVDDDCKPVRKTVGRGRGRARGKRIPKHERKVGRPRKNAKRDESPEEDVDPVDIIDIGYLLEQQQQLYLPPEQNDKGKRIVRFPYYKQSPKRTNEDSS